jgi:hypothetical protein
MIQAKTGTLDLPVPGPTIIINREFASVWRVACGVWRVPCNAWRVSGVWRVTFNTKNRVEARNEHGEKA